MFSSDFQHDEKKNYLAKIKLNFYLNFIKTYLTLKEVNFFGHSSPGTVL